MIYQADEVRARFARRGLSFDPTVEEIVRGILTAVREEGDAALDRFSLDLDGHPVEEVPKRLWREAYEDLDEELRDALETAKERIEAFYREEAKGGFLKAEAGGVLGSWSGPFPGWGSTCPGGAPPSSPASS
jgi:histidinol dehydrogenase